MKGGIVFYKMGVKSMKKYWFHRYSRRSRSIFVDLFFTKWVICMKTVMVSKVFCKSRSIIVKITGLFSKIDFEGWERKRERTHTLDTSH